MWTEDDVEAFIQQHPISTNGAIEPYKIKKRVVNDGDEYVVVTLPFWSNNSSVLKGVLDFCQAALKKADTDIYIRDNPNSLLWKDVEVGFYMHVCDPD